MAIYAAIYLLGWHEGALEKRRALWYYFSYIDLRIQGEWYGLKVGKVHLEHGLLGQQLLELFRFLVAIARLLGHQLNQLDQLVNEALLLAQIIGNAAQMKVTCGCKKWL